MKKTENKEIPRWKDDMLKRLKEEEHFDKWAVEILRASRGDRRYKGKKERIDHDLIAYGVSRDGKKRKS